MTEVKQRRKRSSTTLVIAGWRATALGIALGGLLLLTILAPALQTPEFSFVHNGGPVRQVVYVVLFLIALMTFDLRKPQQFLVIPWPIALTLGWCWLSLAWSADLAASLSRLLLTSIVIWLSFATVPRLGGQRAILIARIVLTVALVANFVVVLNYPDIGTHWENKHQWRGFMSHKNHAGALCAITVILCLFGLRGRQHWIGLFVAVPASIFLWFTVSRTAMVMLAVSVIVAGLALSVAPVLRSSLDEKLQSRIDKIGIIVFAIAILFLVYITFAGDMLVQLTADPTALSKRTQVWQPLLLYYLDRPLLGSGFGAFWSAMSDMKQYGGSWIGNVTQGHNGFLDIAIQIGLPGLLLALFAGIIWPLRQIIRQLGHRPSETAMILALFLFCIGSNITESGFFDRDQVWEVFLMLAIAMLRPVRPGRPGARSAVVELER